MYLKDCIVTYRASDNTTSTHNWSETFKVPYIIIEDYRIYGCDELGEPLNDYRINWTRYMGHTGREISTRDYRLAIARAKSQQPKSE